MGEVKRVLAQTTVKPESKYFTGAFLCEAQSDLQFHFRNFRLQMTPEEFEVIAKCIWSGHENWVRMGRPLDANMNLGLAGNYSALKPKHGYFPDRLVVEQQANDPDYLHVHWKSWRFDLSHEEFLQMADTFAKAAKNLRDE